jgi:hypothetical protein
LVGGAPHDTPVIEIGGRAPLITFSPLLVGGIGVSRPPGVKT